MTGTEILTERDGDGGGGELAPLRPLKHADERVAGKPGKGAAAAPEIIHEDEIEIVDGEGGLADGGVVEDGDGESRLRTGELRSEEDEDRADARAGLTPEERAERKRSRNERRKAAKSRRREGEAHKDAMISALQSQLDDMGAKLDALTKRTDGHDLASVDKAIGETEEYIRQAEAAVSDAFSKQDGPAHTANMKAWSTGDKRLTELNALKRRLVDEAKKPAPVKTDPLVTQRVQDFQADNAWFNADAGLAGTDQDSAVMIGIDKAVRATGLDPKSDAYWEELERRGAEVLPHRFEATERPDPKSRQRRGPPQRGGGADRRGGNSGEGRARFRISKIRVDELKRAGIWDDPEKRSRYIRAFEKYDRNQAAEARRQ